MEKLFFDSYRFECLKLFSLTINLCASVPLWQNLFT